MCACSRFFLFGCPSRFAPENQSNINKYAYLPFGIGPRHCLGMKLALLELRLTLITLLQKYKIVRSTKLAVIRTSFICFMQFIDSKRNNP